MENGSLRSPTALILGWTSCAQLGDVLGAKIIACPESCCVDGSHVYTRSQQLQVSLTRLHPKTSCTYTMIVFCVYVSPDGEVGDAGAGAEVLRLLWGPSAGEMAEK